MIVCGDVLDPNHPELSVPEDGRIYWPSNAAIPKTSSLQSSAAYLAFKPSPCLTEMTALMPLCR